ncbi:hypothetical protein [Palleronia rufa]|uniref:hypothetical protein n=1 Tax=Palleronia rufa TaxID=1530186 RepID=UPI0039EE4009
MPLLSGTAIFLSLGRIEIAETSVVGLRFAAERVRLALAFLIGAAALGHGVQWYGDWISVRNWTLLGRKLGEIRYDARAEASKFDRLREDLHSFASRTETEDSDETARNARQIADVLPLAARDVAYFGIYARLYLCGWHLGLPMLAAAVAIGALLWTTPA